MTLGIFIFVTLPLLLVLIMTWFIFVSAANIESDMTVMRDEFERRGWPDWKPGASHKPDDAVYRRDEPDDSWSNKTRVLDALMRSSPKTVIDGLGSSLPPGANQRPDGESPFIAPFPDQHSPYHWQEIDKPVKEGNIQ